MDNNSAVESAPESSERFSHFSWEGLTEEAEKRLALIKKLREIPGAQKMMPAFSDTILHIARGEHLSLEEIEDFQDRMLVHGLILETDTDETVPAEIENPQEKAVIETGETAPPEATAEMVATVGNDTQGFARRPTPNFFEDQKPAIVQMPVATPLESISEAIPTVETADSFEKIQEDIIQIKNTIGFQRFVTALQKQYPEEGAYIDALTALGDLKGGDLLELRAKVEDFREKAKALISADEQRSKESPTVDVPIGAENIAENVREDVELNLPEEPAAEPVVASSAPVEEQSSSWNNLDINRVQSDAEEGVVSVQKENDIPAQNVMGDASGDSQETGEAPPPVDMYRIAVEANPSQNPTIETAQQPVSPSSETVPALKEDKYREQPTLAELQTLQSAMAPATTSESARSIAEVPTAEIPLPAETIPEGVLTQAEIEEMDALLSKQ